jgi:propionyl-CoA synthetase
LVVKLPMPPGASSTLWNADERFRATYVSTFAGYYETADAGYVDDTAMCSWCSAPPTSSMLPAIAFRPARSRRLWRRTRVAECAVIRPAESLRIAAVGFLVLKAGVERPYEEIVAEVVKMVRARIGAVAALKTATVVDRLPKRRSGKIVHATMRRSPTASSTRPWHDRRSRDRRRDRRPAPGDRVRAPNN